MRLPFVTEDSRAQRSDVGTRAVQTALAVLVLSGCGHGLPTSPTPTATDTSTSSTSTAAPAAPPGFLEEVGGGDSDGGGGGEETTITPMPPDCSVGANVALVGYRLVQVSAIASPLSDPTGITADSTGFWILNGGGNPTHTLVHSNPATG